MDSITDIQYHGQLFDFLHRIYTYVHFMSQLLILFHSCFVAVIHSWFAIEWALDQTVLKKTVAYFRASIGSRGGSVAVGGESPNIVALSKVAAGTDARKSELIGDECKKGVNVNINPIGFVLKVQSKLDLTLNNIRAAQSSPRLQLNNIDSAKFNPTILMLLNANSKNDNDDLVYSCNYYSIGELTDTLNETEIIQSTKNDVSPLVQVICQYAGVASWDKTDKSRRIGLHYSPNNDILYAILDIVHDENDATEKQKKRLVYDSIAMNEWICSDSNYNYRYIFRYFGKEEAKASVREITIGIITQDYKTPLENVPIGVGDGQHSYSWHYGGPKRSRSFFYHGGKNINKMDLNGILLGPAATKDNDTSDKVENFESYYYFAIDIDMKAKVVTFT